MGKTKTTSRTASRSGMTKSEITRVSNWVKKVVNLSEPRDSLTWVHRIDVDGQPVIVASDGYRLHASWQPEVVEQFPEEWNRITSGKRTSAGQPGSHRPNFASRFNPTGTKSLAYAQEMVMAAKRAAVFGRHNYWQTAPCTLEVETAVFRVSAKSVEVGDVETQMDNWLLENHDLLPDVPVRMGISAYYLQDAFSGFPPFEQVSYWVDSATPCLYVGEVGKQLAVVVGMTQPKHR